MSFIYEPLPGGDELEAYLSGIGERAADMVPAFEAVVDSFHRIETERFEQHGPGWQPLADSTMAMTGSWARQNRNFDEILIDTGVMEQSFTGGTGSYSLMTPFSVEVGSNDPIAHFHQTGGSVAGHPPQRKIVDLREEDAAEWAGFVQGWLFEGVVK